MSSADPILSDPDRHPVDVLAEEFADRLRRGERPTVNDYANRYPQYADELRAALPPIALMEKLKKRNVSGSLNNGLASMPAMPERLGDFRIERELGRGGMGVVYEARQESLGGRLVAVKVLAGASRLDSQRIERFEREARAAAALHHPHIVPVFGVGESDGLHFIVMQRIAGRTLAEVLRQLAGRSNHPGAPASMIGKPGDSAATKADDTGMPWSLRLPVPMGRSYWRWVAQMGRQAAEALAYAHQHGVLHRDVKPGNLLLDASGGEIFITDFGLAKVGEAPTDVTRAGDIIGTLQYMAPEGLKAPADARGDIYGLGATLYELLALRPVVEGATPAAMMKRLADGSPPVAPRRFCPHIPTDLETIILKACAPLPESRYATAEQFADDLQNFLDDKPIRARRVSAVERTWRWCRRNRTLAVLGSAAIVAAIAAIVGGWSAYAATRRALQAEAARLQDVERERSNADAARKTAEAAKLVAEESRKQAEQNVAMSLDGFEEIFDKIAPPDDRPPPWIGGLPEGRPPGGEGPGMRPGGPPGGPRRNAQDALVLQSILSFYDRFSQRNRTNTRLQAEAAKAYRRVGDSYSRMSMTTEADTSYRRSASLYEELVAAEPEVDEHRLGWAESMLWINIDNSAAKSSDVEMTHRAASSVEVLLDVPFESPRDADTVARIFLKDGRTLKAAGEHAKAIARFGRSAQAWAAVRTSGGSTSPLRPGEPTREELDLQHVALLAMAETQAEQGKKDDAKATLQQVWTLVEKLPTRQRPGPPGAPGTERAKLFDSIAAVATACGDVELAGKATAKAAEARAGARPRRP